MAPDLDGRAVEVGQAFAGTPQRVGWFRFYVDDQRWEWSEQVQRMHGYRPGTVTPTTDLVLHHKHPDDGVRVGETIHDMVNNRRAFSIRHRIVDTRGAIHHVVVVGDPLVDSRGVVVGTHGYYVDLTGVDDRSREDLITARVAEITERRAVIEQAKGMLMLVYGLDDEAAFDLLRWRSQCGNVKLRRLAEKLVDSSRDARDARDEARGVRSVFDQVLLVGEAEGAGADGAAVAGGI